jgi:Ca2+-binding RTX toxin-like protein
VATITGTSGNDSLLGTSSNDTISGLGGNDTLNGSGGLDFFDGGSGFDTLDFRSVAGALVFDFATGSVAGAAGASFTGIERVQAGSGSDRLEGAAGGQNLSGQGGNDTLHGGAGIDTLWGGSGADRFMFRENGAANADQLGDFASGTDKIVLDGSVMSALGPNGNFSAGDSRFKSNATGTATDADDRIVFNSTTRQLFYDADGSGSGGAALLATLQGGGTLAATDLVVEESSGSGGQAINGTAGNDSLVGGDGNETINGFGGNDTLDGREGADLLLGGDGADVLRDFENSFDDPPVIDTLDGGLGNDTYDLRSDPFSDRDTVLRDAGGVDTVLVNHSMTLPGGFENLEVWEGTSGTGNGLDNVIRTMTNEPRFYLVDGADGDDTLIGGGDHDEFRFQAGSGNYGDDVVEGGGGDLSDTLNFFGARSAIVADMAAGLVRGGGIGGSGSVQFTGIEEIFGGAFADRLTGGAGADTLFGGGGSDTLNGAGGNDQLEGSDGSDHYVFSSAPGAANADEILSFGFDGADKIVLDASAMPALGASGQFAAGDARFFAGDGASSGQDGSDRVVYDTASGRLWYDADGSGGAAAQLIAQLVSGDTPTLFATDIIVANGLSSSGSVVNGTSGNDALSGTVGNDTINGLGGNDTILVGTGSGSDAVDGGAGFDSLEFKDRAAGALVVDFGSGTAGPVAFANIERLVAGNFNDSLAGNGAAQNLAGQAGADTLWGAGGADTLWGGSGADAFVFREMGSANADRIGDFTPGSDKVHLDDAAFSAIGAAGNFAVGDARFWSAAGATSGHDSNDRVIYNSSTGSLYYDADGSGSGAAQLIATLTGLPGVAAGDIVVI